MATSTIGVDTRRSAFLQAHRDEARAVVRYQADDSHLYDDPRLAQAPRQPEVA